MNIFDKAAEIVNPEKALRRMRARKIIEVMDSGYDESGASHRKKSLKGWRANSRSPKEDIDRNLYTLRQRSRSLYMGAPVATSAIKTNRTNVVGVGLTARPNVAREIVNMSLDEADEWNRKTDAEFRLWSENKHCDATKVNDFAELQQLACISWLMNGDACVLIKRKKESIYSPYNLRLHLIESDRVCNPETNGIFTNDVYKNGNTITNGVEINSDGAVVAYHVCSTYPNSYFGLDSVKKKWTRIPAYGSRTGNPNILMIMESERAEQYRGVPYLSPVIEAIKQLTRYSEAEISAAVLSGFFTAFITEPVPTGGKPFAGIEEEEDDYGNDFGFGPGVFNVLGPGQDIKFADPKRPNTGFDAFSKSYAQYIGAALELSPEVLLKKFDASYSAAKGALEETWKSFRQRRRWLVKDFCQPIYELWMDEAVAIGRIKAPGYFKDPLIRKAYQQCRWNGPCRSTLDPLKEAKAAVIRVENGFSTRAQETTEMNGGDFRANAEELNRENILIGKEKEDGDGV